MDWDHPSFWNPDSPLASGDLHFSHLVTFIPLLGVAVGVHMPVYDGLDKKHIRAGGFSYLCVALGPRKEPAMQSLLDSQEANE